MRTIGLIGGMSWESTAVYYRLINTMVRERRGGLHSAEILLRSIDFTRIVALQLAGDWTGAGALLGDAAEGLARAGAASVLICTNTMHLVADQVATRPGVRLIHVIDATAATIAAAGCRKPLLLATAYTMEHGFYAARMAKAGVATQAPDAADRAVLHGVIFDELCQGIVRPASRDSVLAIIARGRAAGADSVILGCTELCLLLDPSSLGCPVFDPTAIHARAAVDDALGDVRAQRPDVPLARLCRTAGAARQFARRPASLADRPVAGGAQGQTIVNADGCGIGWYGERDDPGPYHGVLPAWSDSNLAALCRQPPSRMFLAHLRSATTGEVSAANCHPLAAGRHLFMHNGQVGEYERVRRRVDALIPDALYARRRGNGDSGAIFLAALGRGFAADPVAAVTKTPAAVWDIMRAAAIAKPLRFAAVHADGAVLRCDRWSSDERAPSLYRRRVGGGVVVASEPFDDRGWVAAPAGRMVTVDAAGRMSEQRLDIGLAVLA